jgi:hypothetical protein
MLEINPLPAHSLRCAYEWAYWECPKSAVGLWIKHFFDVFIFQKIPRHFYNIMHSMRFGCEQNCDTALFNVVTLTTTYIISLALDANPVKLRKVLRRNRFYDPRKVFVRIVLCICPTVALEWRRGPLSQSNEKQRQVVYRREWNVCLNSHLEAVKAALISMK